MITDQCSAFDLKLAVGIEVGFFFSFVMINIAPLHLTMFPLLATKEVASASKLM